MVSPIALMPPSGEGMFAERTAQVQGAQGSDPSGSLDVDLTDDLRDIPPAQAEDYDYKLKVEAVVKTTSGDAEVTKSAVLFVICNQPAPTTGAEVAGENNFPVGGVEAGLGGTSAADAPVAATHTGWVAALGLALAALLLVVRRLRAQGV